MESKFVIERGVLFVVICNDSMRGDYMGFFRYEDFCKTVREAGDAIRW